MNNKHMQNFINFFKKSQIDDKTNQIDPSSPQYYDENITFFLSDAKLYNNWKLFWKEKRHLLIKVDNIYYILGVFCVSMKGYKMFYPDKYIFEHICNDHINKIDLSIYNDKIYRKTSDEENILIKDILHTNLKCGNITDYSERYDSILYKTIFTK